MINTLHLAFQHIVGRCSVENTDAKKMRKKLQSVLDTLQGREP